MKSLIATVFMAIATSVFGSQQTQAAEARERRIREVQIARARHLAELQIAEARHIAELQRAEAEKKILEMERQDKEMLERAKRARDISEAEIAKILERAHPSSQSLEDALAREKARRKASLAAKVAAKNKRRVEILTSETQQLKEKLYKTQMELAKSRSRVEHLSEQLRHLSEQLIGLPKSLGRGTSSGPARRRK